MTEKPENPTELLLAWGRGELAALDRLIPLVHQDLRRMASRHLAGERRNHTLQATALVNEVYLRLIEVNRVQWQNRAHFFAMAARMMRRLLVDWARAHASDKRGGGVVRVSLDEAMVVSRESSRDLLALDEALDAMARAHPRKRDVVELRYFGGLTVEETAHSLSVSVDTVKRDWRFAKLWLKREISRVSGPDI